jgi:hypothetical protein
MMMIGPYELRRVVTFSTVVLGPRHAADVMVGEGHAPVVAVLVSSEGRKADEPIAAPKDLDRGPFPDFPLETGLSRGRAQGP